MFFTDFPRTTASWSSDYQKADIRLNNWMRRWCRDSGYILVDPYARCISQSTGEPLSGTVYDGIHDACFGGYTKGKALADALQSFLPKSDSRMQTPLDVYDATYNPSGNIIGAVGMMQGTGGTNDGTGASGTVPAGWTNRIVTGTGTAVASKESPRNDGFPGDKMVVVYSATTAMDTRIYPSATITNWSIGDNVVAEMDLEFLAGSSGIDYINCYLAALDSGYRTTAESTAFKGAITQAYPLPNVAFSGRLRTVPFVIPLNTTYLNLRIEGKLEAGGSGTIKIGNVTIRKIVDGELM